MDLEGSNEEKIGRQQKEEVPKGNVGKCLTEAFESPVALSMCDSPIKTVLIKRWVPLER